MATNMKSKNFKVSIDGQDVFIEGSGLDTYLNVLKGMELAVLLQKAFGLEQITAKDIDLLDINVEKVRKI